MGGMLSSESTQDLPAEMPKEKKKDSKKDSKASKGTKQQKTSSSSTTSVSIPLAPLLDNVEGVNPGSVIGIDLGNYRSVLAVAQNKGIDIIVNEMSNRFTPSMVGFNGNQRLLGEGASAQAIMNSKNIITSLKHLIGKSFDEPDVEIEKNYIPYNLVPSSDQSTAAQVLFNGKEQTFDTIQLTAMLLGKLKEISENNLTNPLSGCVISVPAYYTDRQRYALLAAAEIANLNCLRLINEPTALALVYGLTRAYEFEDLHPRNVVFIDIGHSAMTISIASVTREKAEMKSVAFDRFIGGRVIDHLMIGHFIKKVKEIHKVDISQNQKSILKLQAACEKLKHVLSANQQAYIQIDCLTETLDINILFKREELEELISPLLDKIDNSIGIALRDAGITKEDVHFVEVFGGSTRIPCIQQRITTIFNKPDILRKTLNLDEAIARGCALQCAMMCPSYKVRDYEIKDITVFGINLVLKGSTDLMNLYKPGVPTKGSKILKFPFSNGLEIKAEYSNTNLFLNGTAPVIGRWAVDYHSENLTKRQMRVQVRINESGIFLIGPAEIEFEDDIKDMEIDDDSSKGDNKTKKFKEIPIISHTWKLNDEQLENYKEVERKLAKADKELFETLERKNDLETYIYEIRDKCELSRKEFVSENEKKILQQRLSEVETWFNENDDSGTKETFIEKLQYLKEIGDPIEFRYIEAEERDQAVFDLKQTIKHFRHLGTENKSDGIKEACDSSEEWIDSIIHEQNQLPKDQTPIVKVSEIKSSMNELRSLCNLILTNNSRSQSQKRGREFDV